MTCECLLPLWLDFNYPTEFIRVLPDAMWVFTATVVGLRSSEPTEFIHVNINAIWAFADSLLRLWWNELGEFILVTIDALRVFTASFVEMLSYKLLSSFLPTWIGCYFFFTHFSWTLIRISHCWWPFGVKLAIVDECWVFGATVIGLWWNGRTELLRVHVDGFWVVGASLVEL